MRPDAYGACFSTTDGTLTAPAGDDPEIRLLTSRSFCEIEIAFGRRREVIDLTAPVTSELVVFPGRTPMIESSRGIGATSAALDPVPAQPAKLLAEDEAFIERVRRETPPAIAIHCPRWLGVTASTEALFSHVYPVPRAPNQQLNDLTSDELNEYAKVLLATGVKRFVLSAGDERYLALVEKMSAVDPELRFDVLWHGSYLQFGEDYDWASFKMWLQAARSGRVHSVNTVKAGIEDFIQGLGIRSKLLLNFVPGPLLNPPAHNGGDYGIGLWVAASTFRKLPYAMLSAVKMTSHAVGGQDDERMPHPWIEPG